MRSRREGAWLWRTSLSGMAMSVATSELGTLFEAGRGRGCQRCGLVGWDTLDSRDRRHARKPDCLSTRNAEKAILSGTLISRGLLDTHEGIGSAAGIPVDLIEGTSSCASIPSRNETTANASVTADYFSARVPEQRPVRLQISRAESALVSVFGRSIGDDSCKRCGH